MAKKRKRTKARRKPPGPTRPQPAPGRVAEAEGEERRAPRADRRLAEQRRRQAARRRRRARNYAITTLAILAVAGLVAFNVVRGREARRAFDRLARAAGCSQVRETSTAGASDHFQPGEPPPRYDSEPPTHGRHLPTPLSAGVYRQGLPYDPRAPQNIYQAVHSLEHGYVIVWYRDLPDPELDRLDRALRDERKVILAAYPTLRGGRVALTAWGVIQRCQRADLRHIRAFIARYRESRRAPEPAAP